MNKKPLLMTLFWILAALVFNLIIYFTYGPKEGIQFFTGYLLEQALSIDNFFVIIAILAHFKIPTKHQQKVLFWGVLGAFVMRLIFITAGVALVQRFHFVLYVFGGFLLLTGIKLATEKDNEIIEESLFVRLYQRFFPVTYTHHGDRFFYRKCATPLFLALIMVEMTDLIFAIDSIPAIFSVTTDPVIVYTSNIFAILSLRSMHLVMIQYLDRLKIFRYTIPFILMFIGAKMVIAPIYDLPLMATLAVVLSVIIGSFLYSFRRQ